MTERASKPRCNQPGCNRFAAPAHLACRAHITADADETARRLDWAAMAGSYRELLGPTLSRIMAEAAADTGLDDEVGALRVTMARVLSEESDPVRLAQAISRLSAASVAAARARRAITGELADNLTDALSQILLDLDAAR
jgi:hypothetical protein